MVKETVKCPYCGLDIRSEDYEGHLLVVHGRLVEEVEREKNSEEKYKILVVLWDGIHEVMCYDLIESKSILYNYAEFEKLAKQENVLVLYREQYEKLKKWALNILKLYI